MKKVLLILVAACFVFSLQAQKYAVKNSQNLKLKPIQVKNDNDVIIPFLPVNKPSAAHNKSVEGVLIGTSVNAYTAIYDPNYQIDYNPELNVIMHTHRAGGLWGGSGGDLRCVMSTDHGNTWNTDSVVFLKQGNNNYRYPNGIIYNPAGNTNLNDAYILVNGPITDGAGWNFNYFDSKKKDGSNAVINQIAPINASQLERINLSGGNGKFYTGSLKTNAANNWYERWYIRKMEFDPNTNGFNVNTLFDKTRNWKMRQFSNASIEWWFNWNNVFDKYGESGYAWCFGAEQEFDPYKETSTPIVWGTWNGGQDWIQASASGCWHTLSNLTDFIWPVRQSLIDYPNNPELWQYRPFFEGGSSIDDNYSPGIIDYQGNLHFLAIVSGRYSNHQDSLGYSYANHPNYLFDVYTTGWDPINNTYTWDVQFVDTLLSQVVGNNASPYVGQEGGIGWEHMLNISASPDGKVIFAIWTDTDPQFDSLNTLPDIKVKAFNYENWTATPVINFTQGEGGLYFWVNTSHYVVKDGNDYVIPLSYIDVYETGNPDVAQKHYFAKNLRITPADFTETIAPSTITGSCITQANINKYNNSLKVDQNNPNPAKNNTQITVTLPEASDVTVTITNMMGQQVMEINKGKLSAGKNIINVNVSSLQSGVYFYTVKANNATVTKKMIVE